MHFVVGKVSMQNALLRVISSCQSRAVMQVLSCVKLEAKDGFLYLTTTNLETESVDVISCTVLEPGLVAVQMDTIVDIVKQIPKDESITFNLDSTVSEESQKLSIECGEDRYTILCLPAVGFPTCFTDAYSINIDLPGKLLKLLISRVAFAMSQSQDRYNLNGLYLTTKVSDGLNYLCAVATDGHRLAFARVVIEDSNVLLNGCVVPRKAVNDLSKIIESDASCSVMLSANKMSVSVGQLRYSTKLLDVVFPDYVKVVPANNDKLLEVDRVLLLNKIEAASTTTKGKGVQLVMSSESLDLIGRGPSGDRSHVRVKNCSFSGSGEFKTTYNPAFIVDALKSIVDQRIRLCFSEAMTQVLIQSTTDSDFFYVVMPMKNEE